MHRRESTCLGVWHSQSAVAKLSNSSAVNPELLVMDSILF
jgi:hypothetical protein